MNTIGGVPPPTFQTVPTHSPLGKPPVGVEPSDAPLPPVEETTASDELRHRDVIAKQRDDNARRQGEEQAEPESEQTAQTALEEQLEKALEEQLMAVAQTSAVVPQPGTYHTRHLAEFEKSQLPPGSLLDQQA